jgi:hypothetical protein
VRTGPVLQVAAGSRLQPGAPLAQLKLAVGRAVIAQVTDYSEWSELALLTDTESVIQGHSRLLRSLRFGDDDYEGCVHDVVPSLLGFREVDPNPPWPAAQLDGPQPTQVFLDNLILLEEHLNLPAWLADHEPRLHRLLYAHDLAEAAALHSAAEVASKLDLTKGPALVDAAVRTVGRHPSQVDAADPDAQLLKQMLGATTSQLHAVFGLRNRVGTGHGRAGDIPLDPALARLTIGSALHAVTYLLQVADDRATQPALYSQPPPAGG